MSICVQIATLIAVYANWDFAFMNAIGWGWAGVIWLFSLIFYLPLDVIKFAVRYILRGDAWELITERRVCIFFILGSLLLELHDIMNLHYGACTMAFRPVRIHLKLLFTNSLLDSSSDTQSMLGRLVNLTM